MKRIIPLALIIITLISSCASLDETVLDENNVSVKTESVSVEEIEPPVEKKIEETTPAVSYFEKGEAVVLKEKTDLQPEALVIAEDEEREEIATSASEETVSEIPEDLDIVSAEPEEEVIKKDTPIIADGIVAVEPEAETIVLENPEEEETPVEDEEIAEVEETTIDEPILEVEPKAMDEPVAEDAPATTDITENVVAVPVEEPKAVDTTVVPLEDNKVIETKVVTSPSSIPTPLLDDNVSSSLLYILLVVVVLTVIFTIAVAIRGANKQRLGKAISAALAILFTALPIVISTLVSGWKLIWLSYLLLLFTYLVFTAKWRNGS